MKREKFFCNECQKIFDEAKFIEETHGLDGPPYERVAVCPRCSSENFLNFDALIEKTEIAERLLPAVMHMNRYIENLKDVFGIHIENIDLRDSVDMIVELIYEMFDFMDANTLRQIFEMNSENDVNKIWTYLKGGL